MWNGGCKAGSCAVVFEVVNRSENLGIVRTFGIGSDSAKEGERVFLKGLHPKDQDFKSHLRSIEEPSAMYLESKASDC